ncbi:conserved hypothetical protein [Thermotomaculum hydrothermale]|uniref:YgjP-like metallopeptidase domain-containing protein n=1 Tax=Thermotomaculum hydrothermale TaxID=981385 RepID=A0A7R6Q0Y4_9BACT|nr:SprT family zinc-dependent metalloprotease [Thermotomaculum hydrothermale]BBB33583.1 conserved hypothetical protein [Thermotomaculum hydrothermale]
MKIEIIRKRIKNIYIRVDEDGTIKVSAPYKTPDSYIKQIINKRLSKLKRISEEKKKAFVNLGNAKEIPYLGKMIEVKKIKSKKYSLEFRNNTLFLHLKEVSPEKSEELILKWYKGETKRIVLLFIEKYLPLISRKINRISVKNMKTRWGSCNSKKGYLNFSLKLAQKPIKGIEYVVVHELTHLIHANHSKEFYNRLERLMPDYKKAKETLY